MNNAAALCLIFVGALILLSTASVFAQNQTSVNQSAGTNTTSTYNTTSALSEDGADDGSGQISKSKRG